MERFTEGTDARSAVYLIILEYREAVTKDAEEGQRKDVEVRKVLMEETGVRPA